MNKLETSVEFTVSFDKDDFEPARLKALERLARDVKIPGFREGRAPANVVEQHVNPNELATTTLDILVRTSIPKLFEDADLLPVSVPHVDILKFVPGDNAEIKIMADIMPDVHLGDYEHLQSPYAEPEIHEHDVEDVLNRIAEQLAEPKVVRRESKMGDEVIFDFEGFKDGKPFDGGAAKDYKLRLGSGQFIPGFEEGLVGHASGDKFKIDLSFPADYGVADLAGQPVVFEILMKQVSEVIKPALDDDLAKQTGGFATIEELRDDIRKNLEAQAKQEADNHYKDDLLNELVNLSETKAPQSLVEEQADHIKQDMLRNLKARGLSINDYLTNNKQTEEEWLSEVRQAAERRVISSLIVQALSATLDVKVSDEDFNKQLAEMRHAYRNDNQAKSEFDKPEVQNGIRNQMRINLTMDKLVEINKPHAPKPKAEKKAEKPAKKATKKTEKKSEKKTKAKKSK